MPRILVAACLVLLLSPISLAQGPSPQEIDQKVKETLEGMPLVEAEVAEGAAELGLTVRYRQVPTDPEATLAQVAPGVDPSMLRNYYSVALPFIVGHLQRIGTLEATRPVKIGRATLPAGTYEFGVRIDAKSLLPTALVVHVGEGSRARVLPIPVQRKKADEEHETLRIAVDADKGKGWFVIDWAAATCRSAPMQPRD